MAATNFSSHVAKHQLRDDPNDAMHLGCPRDLRASFRQVDPRFCES